MSMYICWGKYESFAESFGVIALFHCPKMARDVWIVEWPLTFASQILDQYG